MPTYQYACTACEHQLEAVQSFADDPLTQCPVCQGRLRKLFGSVGIVFKGSGFYRTDSRAGASNGNGAGEQKQSSSEGSADKGTENKASGSEKSSDKKSSGDSGGKEKAPATATSSS